MREREAWSWCRQLEVAARVGLPPAQVLAGLHGRTARRLWGYLLRGQTLAGALAACGVLSRREAARLEQAVRVGEGAAALGEVAAEKLARLTRASDNRISLAYPLLVLVLSVLAAVVVGGHLLPGLLLSLRAAGGVAGLPPATRAVLWAASRWQAGALLVVVAVLLLGLAAVGGLGWPGDRVILSLPGLGQAVLWRERARLLEAVACASRAGGFTAEGVCALPEVCGNGHVRRRVAWLAGQLARGVSPAEALTRSGLLPADLAGQVLSSPGAGEAWEQLAGYCREVEREHSRLALAWLEPGLTLLAAGVVAVIALGVVQPLYMAVGRLN